MVVDDEKGLLDAFDTLMRRFGYDAEFYISATKALEAVALDPAGYGLIITDMRMPFVDGLTFVKNVRSLCPRIPVVFMSGFVTAELKEKAMEFKDVVLLEKPFSLEQVFKETIPKLMGGR